MALWFEVCVDKRGLGVSEGDDILLSIWYEMTVTKAAVFGRLLEKYDVVNIKTKKINKRIDKIIMPLITIFLIVSGGLEDSIELHFDMIISDSI